jgi:D-glycero-D-manno-heptose 1,7-bisphosphate phosphatase
MELFCVRSFYFKPMQKVLHKAIFLDRDGVINHDPGDYTKSKAEFTILPDVPKALALLANAGYKLVVITNQAGIAKGLYTHGDVAEIHDFLKSEMASHGVEFTDICYSPYHDDYSKSLTRKPESLMLERAIYLHDIDPSLSYMIGDKERDLEAGKGAGVKGIKMNTNGSLLEVIQSIL